MTANESNATTDPTWRDYLKACGALFSAWTFVVVLVSWASTTFLPVDLSDTHSSSAKESGMALAALGLAATLTALNSVGALARWFASVNGTTSAQ